MNENLNKNTPQTSNEQNDFCPVGAVVMPRFYLGQKVKTIVGEGIIVDLRMYYNGLYIEPEKAKCVVWFGCGNNKEGWVYVSLSLAEIEAV